MKIFWRKRIVTLLTPRENKDPHSISYWREKIFYSILIGGAFFGFFTLIPSIITCLEDKYYIQLGVDIIVFSVVIIFLFDSKIAYKIKTAVFLFFIYALGLSLILMGGSYTPGGYIYLVTFSIVASIWRGTKVAIITIAINIITVTTIGYLSYSQIIIIEGLSSFNLTRWLTLCANLFLANGISAISVGLLLDGLEKTINHTLQLKNQLSEERTKLIAAKQKAEEADHLKTAFLANMTHELKTPLNAVIGFSNLIIEEKTTDINKIYKYQKIIAEGGDMLLGLINDILDISMIESGQLKITKKQVCLKDIVNEVSHTFDDKLVAELHKNIKFNIIDNIKNEAFQFLTDPLRLKQVINNLIKNAIKFTDEGEINFSYKLINDDQYLMFKIQDTGIGIPKEKQASIFDRFTKLEAPCQNKIRGTGLGLAISKEIVEMLGGKIWLESTPGEGSIFYFTIALTVSENNILIEVS